MHGDIDGWTLIYDSSHAWIPPCDTKHTTGIRFGHTCLLTRDAHMIAKTSWELFKFRNG